MQSRPGVGHIRFIVFARSVCMPHTPQIELGHKDTQTALCQNCDDSYKFVCRKCFRVVPYWQNLRPIYILRAFSHSGREGNIMKFSPSKQSLNHEAKRSKRGWAQCVVTLQSGLLICFITLVFCDPKRHGYFGVRRPYIVWFG